jgi:hypothetical protein
VASSIDARPKAFMEALSSQQSCISLAHRMATLTIAAIFF